MRRAETVGHITIIILAMLSECFPNKMPLLGMSMSAFPPPFIHVGQIEAEVLSDLLRNRDGVSVTMRYRLCNVPWA